MLPIALYVVAFLAPVVPAQPSTNDVEGKLLTDGIAAIVNAELITVSELQAEMADETFRLKARHEGNELTERLVQKRYEILNRMIERKLQLQEAKAKQISISDEEVEKAWEQLRRNPAGFPAGGLSIQGCPSRGNDGAPSQRYGNSPRHRRLSQRNPRLL